MGLISAKVTKAVLDANKVMTRAHRSTVRAITQAAKYVHKATRHAIRIGKRPSKPGKPPHSRAGILKNAVASRVWPHELKAKVGVGVELGSPARLSAIAGIHESGGTVTLSPVSYRVGQYGPIEIGGTRSSAVKKGPLKGQKAFMMRLKTPAMASRASRLAASAIPTRSAKYPQRPFVRPTLQKCLPRVLKLFHL